MAEKKKMGAGLVLSVITALVTVAVQADTLLHRVQQCICCT